MWLIEAYRSMHGPSFARDMLTVAMGDYPDVNEIRCYVSVYDEIQEQMFWREVDNGQIAQGFSDPESIESWLNSEMERTLGIYGYDEKATLWRHDGFMITEEDK